MKKSVKNTIALTIFSLGIIIIPSLLISLGLLDEYTAQIFTLSGINSIMAISVNVVCGITGQLSLGQAGFMAIGSYSTIIFTQTLGIPMPVSIIMATLVTVIFGILIGFPTLKLQGDYLAIVTLGFGEIIRVLLVNFKGLTGGANGLQFSTIFFLRADYAYCLVISVLVVVVILLLNLVRLTYVRAILAFRVDEIAANSVGVDVFKYKMIGFAIASCIAGLGGALYAPVMGFIKPDIASFNRSIDYLIFVVLGGMGSISGSIIAAFVLTFLQEWLRFLQDYRLLIYPLILIFVMLFRPQGLLGMKAVSVLKIGPALKNLTKKMGSREKSLKKGKNNE